MNLKSQKGFSLVELLIAVALGIILSWAIMDVTLNASKTDREVQLTSEVIENGRYATDLLRNEIRLAGYFGNYINYSSGAAAQPNPCTSPMTVAVLTQGMTFPTFGLNNVAAGSQVCSGQVVLTGSDAFLVRRIDTEITPVASLSPTQHYFQSTPQVMVLNTGNNVASFSLKKKDGTTSEDLRAFHQDIYFVGTDRVLKRQRLVNGAYVTEPLVEGVDDMQVQYGIDRSGNGSPNSDGANAAYVDIPATTAEWENVVAIKVYLLMSSNYEAPGLPDNKTYSYAGKTVDAAAIFNDRKKRRLFTTVARLSNISMKRSEL